jgi:DNA repair protein RadC
MKGKDVLSSPKPLVHFSIVKLAGLPHEAFMVVYLNTHNEIIHEEIINQGTVDQVAVYPRRIIEMALARQASGLILCHNHPSGYTAPSKEDKALTLAIKQAGRLFDIRLVDHLIVGKGGYFSFKEGGLL